MLRSDALFQCPKTTKTQVINRIYSHLGHKATPAQPRELLSWHGRLVGDTDPPTEKWGPVESPFLGCFQHGTCSLCCLLTWHCRGAREAGGEDAFLFISKHRNEEHRCFWVFPTGILYHYFLLPGEKLRKRGWCPPADFGRAVMSCTWTSIEQALLLPTLKLTPLFPLCSGTNTSSYLEPKDKSRAEPWP